LIPAHTTYLANSLVVDGSAKSDTPANDTADFNSTTPSGVTFFVGTGATSSVGGTVNGGASGSVKFRVTVN